MLFYQNSFWLQSFRAIWPRRLDIASALLLRSLVHIASQVKPCNLEADGEGEYLHADGSKYVGQWSDDRQDGQGVEALASAFFRGNRIRITQESCENSGSFARGRCRRGRSEIPHFCSKLLLFALVLQEKQRKAKKKGKMRKKKGKMRRKRGKMRKKKGKITPTPSTPTPLRTSQKSADLHRPLTQRTLPYCLKYGVRFRSVLLLYVVNLLR